MAQELWQIAKPFGRPAKFKTPQELWDAFIAYCTWAENNPLTIGKERRQKSKGQGEKAASERFQRNEEAPRPLSLVAFRMHAGIKRDWDTFKKEYAARKTADFCGVLQAIEESVRQQQVENAMVGIYKENIVSRINNISDTIKQEVSGEIATRKSMSISEAKALLADIDKEI